MLIHSGSCLCAPPAASSHPFKILPISPPTKTLLAVSITHLSLKNFRSHCIRVEIAQVGLKSDVPIQKPHLGLISGTNIHHIRSLMIVGGTIWCLYLSHIFAFVSRKVLTICIQVVNQPLFFFYIF